MSSNLSLLAWTIDRIETDYRHTRSIYDSVMNALLKNSTSFWSLFFFFFPIHFLNEQAYANSEKEWKIHYITLHPLILELWIVKFDLLVSLDWLIAWQFVKFSSRVCSSSFVHNNNGYPIDKRFILSSVQSVVRYNGVLHQHLRLLLCCCSNCTYICCSRIVLQLNLENFREKWVCVWIWVHAVELLMYCL